MALKDRIKEVRNDMNLTQAEFAERLKVGRSTVTIWETNDERPPSDITLQLIAKNFGVDEEWLKTGVGDKHPTFSRNEQIHSFMTALMEIGKNPSESEKFKLDFIDIVSRLSPEAWEKLADVAREIKTEYTKKEQGE